MSENWGERVDGKEKEGMQKKNVGCKVKRLYLEEKGLNNEEKEEMPKKKGAC